MKSNALNRIIPGYFAIMILLVISIDFLVQKDLLDSANFIHWDAEHYFKIKNDGYQGFLVAFFPLFPLLWKMGNFSIYGAVVFNSFIFLGSFYILAKKLQLSVTESLVTLSIPGFMFFFLPYSEAIFFACGTAIILGLRSNSQSLIWIGLFMSTLSRPAFTVFLPALIIVEFCTHDTKKALRNILLESVAMLTGIFVVAILQFKDTGEWFKFFSVQSQWGNALQIPSFPLSSWSGDFIVRLDGTALLAGGLSGMFLLIYLLKRGLFKQRWPAELIFSLAYLGGISLTVLLFRGGSLFSLNRFVYATPFIVVAFHYWWKSEIKLSKKYLLSIFTLILLYWLMFGFYVHLQTFLLCFLVSLYVMLLFLLKSSYQRINLFAAIILIILNSIFQIVLFFRFLQGDWVA